MTFTENANRIFNQAIADYHIKDNIDTPINNPFAADKKKTPAEKNLHRSLSRKFTEPLQYANRYECFCLK